MAKRFSNTLIRVFLIDFLNESDILDSVDYMIIDTGAGIGGITQVLKRK